MNLINNFLINTVDLPHTIMIIFFIIIGLYLSLFQDSNGLKLFGNLIIFVMGFIILLTFDIILGIVVILLALILVSGVK